MASGHSACFAEVIETQHVRELCPEALDNLTAVLTKYNIGFDTFCKAIQDEDMDDLFCDDESLPDDFDAELPMLEIEAAWAALKGAFQFKTRVGDSELELGLGYHDQQDEGDRYDEVDGGFFCVGGVTARTPAAEALGERLQRKFYVSFG